MRARSDHVESRVWTNLRQRRMRLEPQRLVFVDETSVNTKMVRLRGHSLRGTRLAADALFGTGEPRLSSPGCAVTV